MSSTKVTTTSNLGNNAFTNLAALTKVELPGHADVGLGNFGTPAGSTQDWKIQYGSDTTSNPAVLKGSSNNFAGPNSVFNKVINETIEIAASINNQTVSLSNGLFNGNSTLKTLKLNRTNPPSSAVTTVEDSSTPATYLWDFQLGTAPNSDNTNLDAAYASAPLGNNTNLNTIEFSGFKLGNGTVSSTGRSEAEDTTNSFNKITNDTWSQVASIMNMFSKWSDSTSEEQTQDGTTNTKPSNLATWTESGNSWIQADLTQDSVKSSWSTTTDGSATTQAIVTTQDSGSNSLTNSTTSATKKHNGVEWKYENKGATSSTGRTEGTGEITIEGKVNIYRAKNGSNSYQTTFVINK